MNSKINRKKLGHIGAWVAVFVWLWLVIFQIPWFFTPLRFPPQEMTVYRYGESVTLTPSDIEFYRLYFRLRSAGKGTIAHVISEDVIMDSYYGFFEFEDDEPYFCDEAIVVYARYDSVQTGRLLGSSGEKYNLVAFAMDGKQSDAVNTYLTRWSGNVCALYKNTNGSRETYRTFANYGSLDKAADYIDSMDFSKRK